MAYLELTISESERQIISGFPEYITLSTNTPANIFYTLDGTEPNEYSDFYVDKIYLPTNGTIFTFKARAYTSDLVSEIIEETYSTIQNHDRTRLGVAGITVLNSEDEIQNSLSYDVDGNPTQSSIVNFNKLDLIASTTNRKGEDIVGGTTIDFINFDVARLSTNTSIISRLSEHNFNPRSQYMIIDGTTEAAKESQMLPILNRPLSTFNTNHSLNNSQIISANLIRYYANPHTGRITFYYWDSINNRWLISNQQLDTNKSIGITSSGSVGSGQPAGFVFKWIEYRTQSWK